jgi:hypothetical protein
MRYHGPIKDSALSLEKVAFDFDNPLTSHRYGNWAIIPMADGPHNRTCIMFKLPHKGNPGDTHISQLMIGLALYNDWRNERLTVSDVRDYGEQGGLRKKKITLLARYPPTGSTS